MSVRYPWQVVIATLLLAVLGAYVYLFKLQIVTDRKQLINPALEANRTYLEYLDEFGDNEILVLVVHAGKPAAVDSLPPIATATQRVQMKKLAAAWAHHLRQRPDLFPRVYERIEWPGQNGLPLLYQPMESVRGLGLLVQETRTYLYELAQDPSLENQLRILNLLFRDVASNSILRDRQLAPVLLTALQRYLEVLSEVIRAGGHDSLSLFDQESDLLSALPGHYDADGFMFSENGRLLTAYAHVVGNPAARNRYAEVMAFAETALQTALAENGQADELDAGLAGMPALEYEEIKTTQSDFTRGAILALAGVTALFMLVLGNVIRPALAALCLCCAIAMTFTFAWLFVGHSSLLVMIFTVVLVALGIDFGIHFLTHYEQALAAGHAPAAAILETHRAVGAALWMGGLTTAAAFFSAYMTEFVGLSELGLVAGGGLLFCLLCMTLTFPAMLLLLDNRFPSLRRSATNRAAAAFIPSRILGWQGGARSARWVLLAGVLVAAFGYLFGQYRLDTNLLKLQALEGSANRWQQVLIRNDDRSLFAISTFQDRASLAQMQAKLAASPDLVRRTESLYPALEAQKRQTLAAVCSTLSTLQVSEPEPPRVAGLRRQAWNLRQNIRKLRRSHPDARRSLSALEESVTRFYRSLDQERAGQIRAHLNSIQMRLYRALEQAVAAHGDFFCPPEVELEDLPSGLRARFLGKNGTLALFIYPAANTWEPDNLERFVAGMRKIDPQVMGELVSLYENGNSLIRSFLQASGYSLVAILLLLLLWTHSVRSTLLTLLPLATSAGVLLGVMKLWPEPPTWNFTNFFALPILIGMGVDSGIHLTRAWQSGNLQTFAGAITAVILSALTTMIGFGILASSAHLGVRSLGKILFLGIALSLLCSLTVLPAALKLYAKKSSMKK
ncbi:MAG: MMPL family transporter [bacterium]